MAVRNSTIHNRAYVHDMAYVERSTIDADAKVYQFASVILGAYIGARTVVGPCAMINGSQIGPDTLVSYGVNMGPGFKIGAGVFLGPEVVLCNDLWPRVNKEHFDLQKFTRDGEWAVIIEDGASLGVRATVLPGVRIGRNAMIAAHAVVKRDVPDNHMLYASGRMEEITSETERMEKRMRFVRDPSEPSASLAQEQRDMLAASGAPVDSDNQS